MKIDIPDKFITKFIKYIDYDIHIGKRKLDIFSIYLFALAAILWHLIWILANLSSIEIYIKNFMYYFMYVILFVSGFFSDAKSSDYKAETEVLELIYRNIQTISVATLGLGVLIANASKYKSKKIVKQSYNILKLALFSAFFGLLYVSVPKVGDWVRYVRKTKQILLNFAIFYFILALYLITEHSE